jgi:hypothetical protein
LTGRRFELSIFESDLEQEPARKGRVVGSYLFFLGGKDHQLRLGFILALKVRRWRQARELLAPDFEARHTSIMELARRAWRARMEGLLALMLATGIFGFFHVIFRHPFLWLILCCALTARPWLRTPKPARRAAIAASYSRAVFQQQRKWASHSPGL